MKLVDKWMVPLNKQTKNFFVSEATWTLKDKCQIFFSFHVWTLASNILFCVFNLEYI